MTGAGQGERRDKKGQERTEGDGCIFIVLIGVMVS